MQLKSQYTKPIPPALSNFDAMPDSAHMRPKPCTQILGISLATFWRLAKSGAIRTHKLTERTTTVKVGDLRAFMAKGV
jgi:hypothetical protein